MEDSKDHSLNDYGASAEDKPIDQDAAPDWGEFPEGGLKAWLVVAGHAALMFCTWGYVYAFGIYQAYYEDTRLKNDSPSSIAWIGSLSFAFMCFGFTVGGPLFDRYGGPVVCVPAAIIYVFAVMMTSLCKELYQFILAQGLLQGMALGILLAPANSATPQWFEKKRGLAMGITLSCSSLGGVIFPLALTKLLENKNISFGWTVRVLGFLILPLSLPAAFLIRARVAPRKTDFYLLSAFKEVPYLLVLASMFTLFVCAFSPIYFLPTYAIERGISPTSANYLVVYICAGSLPGRLLPGPLCDIIGSLNTLALTSGATTIVLFTWLKLTSYAGLVVWSVFFGLLSGGIETAGMVALSQVPQNPNSIGTYMGMAFFFAGIAVLISPPINGALIASDHAGTKLSVFNGVFSLAGTVFAVLAKVSKGQGLFSKG